MSTANQEGSGHTFFYTLAQAGLEHAISPISRSPDKRVVSICVVSKMLLVDNEFPFVWFLLNTAILAEVGAVLSGLYCFCFKEKHADSSEDSCDYISVCIIQIFAMRLAHLLLLPVVINLINNAGKWN